MPEGRYNSHLPEQGPLQRRLGTHIHPTVFFTSGGLIIVFVLLTAVNVGAMRNVFDTLQHFIVTNADWFYVLCMNIFLALVIYLMFSRYGQLRLGGADARPEFSVWSWFSMLFSAGMGIGLLFFSVAEPVLHFSSPPYGEGGTADAANLAMAVTFFHWGLHTWGVYALVGLSLAFMAFSRGLPLTIRYAFYPLFGRRVEGTIGNIIDIIAVVATLALLLGGQLILFAFLADMLASLHRERLRRLDEIDERLEEME